MKKKRINECWAWPGRCFKKTILIMRLSLILILFSVLASSASVYSQSTKISLDLKNVTITEAFNVIEEQTYFRFVYDDKLFNDDRVISLNVKERNIEEILGQIFPGKEVSYKILEDNLIVFLPGEQSTKTVKGKVVDDKGEPLPGVTVLIKGTTQGTVTDIDGNFTLKVSNTADVLVFSFVGFEPQEIKVGDRTDLDVGLQPSVVGLDEVIAIGYGTQKKRDIIGSISTITSDEILKASDASSFDAAMQGMAPGLMVSSESGVPGAPVQIKIRGISSISSGTDPLWIIDGIPVVSGSTGRSFDGETSQNVMSLINPSDIESIQVLKDAAATSIYGSRGSNGVILVTTKSGKKGKMTFNVDLKSGVSNWANNDIGLASGAEYIEIMDRAYANSGLSGEFDPQTSLNQLDGAEATITRAEALATNTDWADVISRTGSFVEANVSATQGSDKGNSYLSLRYRKDNSIIRYSDLEVFSVNSNMNYNLLDVLQVNYHGFVSFADNNRVKSKYGKSAAGGWAQVNAFALPWMKVYDDSDTGINGFWNPLTGANALAGISPLNSESNLQTLNLLQGLNATLKIIDGLTLKGEFGANLIYNKGRSWRGEGIRVDGAVAAENKDQTRVINYNAFFNYDKTINEDHWLNVVAGIENTRSYSHYTYLKSESLIGSYHEVGTPEDVTAAYSYMGNESYLRGYFGRANYKFKDKYIVGASIRRDGISKFTKDNRWATFASASLGWIISEEDFFNFDKINMLKLRGSFGQTGNTNIPSGITSDNYGVRTSTTLGLPSTEFESVGNSDIKWETTSTTDVGFDFGLFENRINGSLAYYSQKVEDMLLAVSLPYSAGISGGNIIWQNVGDMRNSGIEFNVDAAVINRAFKWNMGFNVSYNKNKILALDPESDASNVGITQSESAEDQVITLFKKGLPCGNWYMAESAGVDSQKGIPMIYEVTENEDGTTSRTGNIIPATSDNLANNRMILDGKTSLPKLVGGFNSRFAYKNFDMAMSFSFATGHYIYNRLLQSTLTPNRGVRALSNKLLTDAWQQAGDNAKWPQVVMNVQHYYDSDGNASSDPVTYGTEEKFISSMYLEKGDYLKLKNLSLGYTLPTKVVSKLKMQSLRLAVNVTNLFTLTKFSGYDPEVAVDQDTGASLVSYSAMPQARTYSIGLNINF